MITIRLVCNDKPLRKTLSQLERLGKAGKLILNGLEFPDEIARVETCNRSTRTDELTVILHPSDALLRFAAAVSARD